MRGEMFPILTTPEEAAEIAEQMSLSCLPEIAAAYRSGAKLTVGHEQVGGLISVFMLGYVSGVRATKAKLKRKGGVMYATHIDREDKAKGAGSCF